MKDCPIGQIQYRMGETEALIKPKTKCVFVAIYENDGKTIIQPLIAEQETKPLLELLENQTLEVWLSNGKADFSQFDVVILKYKQVLQPLTKCTQVKTRACLENLYENPICTDTCHLSINTGEI